MVRSLQEHLARGYDHYIHGVMGAGKWHKQELVDDIKADPNLSIACGQKLADLQAVVNAGRRCVISATHHRILSDAFKAL